MFLKTFFVPVAASILNTPELFAQSFCISHISAELHKKENSEFKSKIYLKTGTCKNIHVISFQIAEQLKTLLKY